MLSRTVGLKTMATRQTVAAMLAWSWLAVLATCLQLDKSWLQSGRLQDGLLLQVTVPTLYQCLHLCVGRSLCRSVSFHHPSSQCQLNLQSVGWGLSLTSEADWVYLDRQHFQHEEVAGPCSNHQCRYDETCVARACNTAVCIADGGPRDEDCGPPPAAPKDMRLSAFTGIHHHDTVSYTCKVGANWPNTGVFTCNESRMWEGDIGGCSRKDCYDPGLPSSYSGTLSVTSGGITCQRWDTTSPNYHGYVFSFFHRVDGNATAANNYCRAIADPRPWCYKTTSYLFNRWDYCGVPQC